MSLAFVLVTCSACGSGRALNPFDPSSVGGAQNRIRIEVQNLNFNDVTVWAMRQQTQRIRVGRVTGKTDQTFTIQWNLAEPISFRVDVVGLRSCGTGQIAVDPNSRVWVTIPSNLGLTPCRAGRGTPR